MDKILEYMELKLIGENVSPDNIRAKELADIIINLEDSITAVVSKNYPDIPSEGFIVCLVNIDRGSAKLKFTSSIPKVAAATFLLITSSIASNDFNKLPLNSIESLKKIADYSKKRNCMAEFRTDTNSIKPLAVITPSTGIEISDSYYLEGETVLYGRIERVGGAKPKVVIRSSDKEMIYCDVNENIAKELGHKLYNWIGLSGIAKWNTLDYTIESFKIEKILEYKDGPISKAVNELSNVIGKYWEKEKDVISLINKIRGEDK